MCKNQTIMCVHHVRGTCKRGKSCAFSHSLCAVRQNNPTYKTRPCDGTCGRPSYMCTFIHQEDEVMDWIDGKKPRPYIAPPSTFKFSGAVCIEFDDKTHQTTTTQSSETVITTTKTTTKIVRVFQ